MRVRPLKRKMMGGGWGWLGAEVFILEVLSRERFSGEAMAKVLGRTVQSVYAKRSKLWMTDLRAVRDNVVEATRVVKRAKGPVHHRRGLRVA